MMKLGVNENDEGDKFILSTQSGSQLFCFGKEEKLEHT